MLTALRSPYLVALVVTSCGFPRLSELPDGAISDSGSLPFGLELLAGDIGGDGNVDGTGAAARFFSPASLAVDSTGNIYVADQYNHTIRKVTPTGVTTTLAGTAGMAGSADGTGADARFNNPTGVAVDGAGNVYVTEPMNSTVRKITDTGVVTTLAGTAGVTGSADDVGAAAHFNYPTSVAVDSAGNVYVADQYNDIIRKVTPAGVVMTLAGSAGLAGSADDAGADARFNLPRGVAVDSAGNVFVADKYNHTIRKITADGIVTTLAGTAGMAGSADGTGADARFNLPSAVAVDRNTDNIYVADEYNHTLRKVTVAGVVTTLAGTAGISGSADGSGAAARFLFPIGVAIDGAGNVYVSDTDNSTIRKVTAAGVVTTLAGTASMYGTADGPGVAARFNWPESVATDNAGNAYVADTQNHTIRKITAAGVVTTLAGAAGMPGSTDGTGGAARFAEPTGVVTDSAGNVYVADYDNSTIRKITTAGVVTTLAGTPGTSGSADGIGAAARFHGPASVATDDSGNVYVADQLNHIIRKVTNTGAVTTLAGVPGMTGSANGTGPTALFNFPTEVAVDHAGNVYVSDSNNITIRKITASGVVTTLAGAAGMAGSADGTGTAARFRSPLGLTIDNAGNVYVADLSNFTIRKLTPVGVTTTIAGMTGSSGILLGATPRFAHPIDVAIAGDSIIILDKNAVLLLRHGIQ